MNSGLFSVEVTYVPNRVKRSARTDGGAPFVPLDRTVCKLVPDRFETQGGAKAMSDLMNKNMAVRICAVPGSIKARPVVITGINGKKHTWKELA